MAHGKNPSKKNPSARKKSAFSRGYIGPIGDDFPSLIPLIFGLLMFFTAFTITFNAFDSANARFSDDIVLLKIGRSLHSNSYIYSYENFSDLCTQIGVVNLKYVAGLTEDYALAGSVPAAGPGVNKSIFDARFIALGGDVFYCSNVPPKSGTGSVSDFVSLEEVSELRVVSRIYPIALEANKAVKPVHLVVIAWR